jgi:hypothetical protein
MAIRMGDDQAALKYLADYIVAGGKKSTLKDSINAMGVFNGMSTADKRAFLKWITPEEKEMVLNGQAFIEGLKDTSKDFVRENWNAID